MPVYSYSFYFGIPFFHRRRYICTMKLLAFFMAFLILSLSCLSCADESSLASINENVKTEIAQSQHNNDDHEDACSPFCHCICCAGCSVNHMIAIVILSAPQSSIDHSSFYHSSIAEFSIPVWQPPQLS